MAAVRVVWSRAAWRTLVAAPGIQADVTERADRVASRTEATTSDTADVRVESGPTRKGHRARAAVIAYDMPTRRDHTFQALLSSMDAAR